MVFNRWNDDDALYYEYGKVYSERYGNDEETQFRSNLQSYPLRPSLWWEVCSFCGIPFERVVDDEDEAATGTVTTVDFVLCTTSAAALDPWNYSCVKR